MQHRYGRHGFHAWHRLHKRRIEHSKRALVPVELVTVIHVHLHLRGRERIFIVSFGNPEENRTFVEGALVSSDNNFTEPPSLSADPFVDWLSDAKIEAYHKLHSDLKEASEPSLEAPLRAYATEAGQARLRQFPGIDRKGKTILQLVSMYRDAFVTEYYGHLREGRESGDIADEATMAVQRKACEDRDLSLNTTQLPIYGTIRAVEQLLKRTISSDIFERIEQLAVAYEQEYPGQKEVVRNSIESSNPFPKL